MVAKTLNSGKSLKDQMNNIKDDVNTKEQASVQQGQGNPGGRMSIFNSANRLSRGMSRNSISEVVSNTRTAYAEIFNDPNIVNDDMGVKVLAVNRQTQSLPYSGIIHLVEAEGKVYYFYLLLAGSSDFIETRMENVDRTEIEVYTSPAETFTDQHLRKINSFVIETTGFKAENIVFCGHMVVPREVRLWEDSESLKEVAFFADAAIGNAFISNTTGDSFNLAHHTSKEDYFKARIEYNPEPVYNAFGLPVRSDVRISVNAQASGEYGETTMPISSIDAYVDLVLDANAAAGVSNVGGFSGFADSQPQQVQPYIPRIVISRMDNMTDFISPETQMLALLNAGLLSRQKAYLGVWLPRKNVPDDEDLRNLGAVNFELNMKNESTPSRVPLKDESFRQEHFLNFCNRTIQDTPIYSMLVEDGNEFNWVQRHFVNACFDKETTLDEYGKPTGSNLTSYDVLYMAANRLTNGEFNKIYPVGNAICSHDGNRYHSGYFVNKDGEQVDVRSLDYLAMLNLFGATDISSVNTFSDTLDRIDENNDLRMHMRRELYNAAVGRTHVYGKADMINIHPEFMEALMMAADKVGLKIDPNADRHFNVQARGRSNLHKFGMSGSASNVFTSNQRPTNGFGGRNNSGW